MHAEGYKLKPCQTVKWMYSDGYINIQGLISKPYLETISAKVIRSWTCPLARQYKQLQAMWLQPQQSLEIKVWAGPYKII